MPKMCYVPKKFRTSSRSIIRNANAIIADLGAQGFTLTLRQLYYQFIARDLFPDDWIDEVYNKKNGLPLNTKNTMKNYDKLGSVINDARLAGLIDWDAIEDRTRAVRTLAHWDDPSDIIIGAAQQYRVDLWEGQTYRPEVWIEKDALVGVFEGVCQEFDVPLLSCRGYTSQSEMWGAGQRLLRMRRAGQLPMIFHFGDHDPSGMDMTRDIRDRLMMFSGGLELERLALNMPQIEQYDPPPNPAKTSDSRYAGYIAEYGNESWELDALEPAVLVELVRANLQRLIDDEPWQERKGLIDQGREHLRAVSDKWDTIKGLIDGDKWDRIQELEDEGLL